jgi:hypothetical protein
MNSISADYLSELRQEEKRRTEKKEDLVSRGMRGAIAEHIFDRRQEERKERPTLKRCVLLHASRASHIRGDASPWSRVDNPAVEPVLDRFPFKLEEGWDYLLSHNYPNPDIVDCFVFTHDSDDIQDFESFFEGLTYLLDRAANVVVLDYNKSGRYGHYLAALPQALATEGKSSLLKLLSRPVTGNPYERPHAQWLEGLARIATAPAGKADFSGLFRRFRWIGLRDKDLERLCHEAFSSLLKEKAAPEEGIIRLARDIVGDQEDLVDDVALQIQ